MRYIWKLLKNLFARKPSKKLMSNRYVWYDADQFVILKDGDAISVLRNSAEDLYHLIQPNIENQPIYKKVR